MALFTTPIGRRMAYHLDGTQVKSWWGDDSAGILGSADIARLNDEEFTSDYPIAKTTDSSSPTLNISFLFPEKRDIYRYFIFFSTYYSTPLPTLSSVQVSTTTTDGYNGTWTSLTIPSPNGFNNLVGVYDSVMNGTQWFNDSTVSGILTGATQINAIKFVINTPNNIEYLKVLNLYGTINDSSATQRVAWTDNTGTALTTDKLYTTKRNGADIIGGQYLKNLHTNSTSQIVFSVDGEQTTVTNNVTISVDGGTIFNALPYTWTTSLASGAVSSEIKVKYTVPSDMSYGYKYYGITATPTFV